MSYDFAVWDGERPADDAAAITAYDALYARYLDVADDAELVPLAPRVAAFAEALVARRPDLEDQVEGAGPLVYVTGSFGASGENAEAAAELAAFYGLVCFDPQLEGLL